MRGHVHALVENAHHVNQPGIAHAIEQEMRLHGQLPVPWTDIVNSPALPASIRECLAGLPDVENVAMGLFPPPGPGQVIPDFA